MNGVRGGGGEVERVGRNRLSDGGRRVVIDEDSGVGLGVELVDVEQLDFAAAGAEAFAGELRERQDEIGDGGGLCVE